MKRHGRVSSVILASLSHGPKTTEELARAVNPGFDAYTLDRREQALILVRKAITRIRKEHGHPIKFERPTYKLELTK
jgi:hypothetical protein